MLTLQEIFNLSVSRMIAQGEASMDDDRDVCKYRSETITGKVLGCGVGVLIASEDYRPEFDTPRVGGTSVMSLSGNADFISAMTNAGIDLKLPHVSRTLSEIQCSHDFASLSTTGFVGTFKKQIRKRLPNFAKNCPSLKETEHVVS